MILSINNSMKYSDVFGRGIRLKAAAMSVALLLIALVGCADAYNTSNATTDLKIVTTSGILADWASNVAGDRAEVGAGCGDPFAGSGLAF